MNETVSKPLLKIAKLSYLDSPSISHNYVLVIYE